MQSEAKPALEFARSRERREKVRYPIAGAVSFQWKSQDGQQHEARGVTRNIGKAGAFIACESLPPAGSHLSMVVTLPTRYGTYGTVCLCGTGRVRHVRRENLRTNGFGACMEFQLELPMTARPPE
jgi:hypothetical protein